PGVLAVGASNDERRPADFSSWGGIYQKQGILAPGVDIVAAAPGGEVSTHKGSSCAAPMVTGVASLLMSLQLGEGWAVDAALVREAILTGASPCGATDPMEQQRCLGGLLSVPGAHRQIYALGAASRPKRGYNMVRRGAGMPGGSG